MCDVRGNDTLTAQNFGVETACMWKSEKLRLLNSWRARVALKIKVSYTVFQFPDNNITGPVLIFFSTTPAEHSGICKISGKCAVGENTGGLALIAIEYGFAGQL